MGWTASHRRKWQGIIPIGKEIDGLFLPTKVPLTPELNRAFPPEFRFGWNDVLQQYHNRIGLVIDLTKTTKYYSPDVLTSAGIKYTKIFVKGHGSIPPSSNVAEFCRIVDSFISHPNYDRQKLILVHCTHGVNRTGYMICKYLITRRGISPESAIEMFNSLRGVQMEYESYINDIKRTVKPSRSPALTGFRDHRNAIGNSRGDIVQKAMRSEERSARREIEQRQRDADRFDERARRRNEACRRSAVNVRSGRKDTQRSADRRHERSEVRNPQNDAEWTVVRRRNRRRNQN